MQNEIILKVFWECLFLHEFNTEMNLKINLLILMTLLVVLSSCNTEKKKSMSAIVEMEKKTITKELEINDTIANKLLIQYLEFAERYPDAKETPEYIFKAAEITNGRRRYVEAITLFEKVFTKYPKYKRAPESMFLCGFISETSMNNLAKAGEYYKKFIETYPENPLRKDAEASLKNLNKSPEELIREFEKMNKETQPAS